MAFIYISNGPGAIIEKLDNHFGSSNDFFLSKVSSQGRCNLYTGGDMGGEGGEGGGN